MLVKRILTNEIYIGTLIQHKSGTPNHKVKKRVEYERDEWIVIAVSYTHLEVTNGILMDTRSELPAKASFSMPIAQLATLGAGVSSPVSYTHLEQMIWLGFCFFYVTVLLRK